ncbi:hypothetical protein [Arthrobacter sp. R4-81]
MNSARSLLALFGTWEIPPNQSALNARGGDPNSLNFWAEHQRALDWLSDIQVALNALADSGTDVSVYRKKIPAWFKGIFGLSTGWTTASSEPLVDEAALDMLHSLASLLDIVKWEPEFGDVQANVFETLLHAEDLIRNDSHLSDSAKRYLIQLIQQVRFTMDNMATDGAAAARTASMQLVGALTTTAVTADTKDKGSAYLKYAVELARTAGTTVTTKAVESGFEWINSLTQ